MAALVGACGGDDDDGVTPPPDDAGLDVVTEAPAVADAGPDAAQIARGRYLVDHVSLCIDCHTPRLPTGALDMSRYLGGAECFIDVNGRDTDGGCLNTPNLTNHPTGLQQVTDEQIKGMFMNGKYPDGSNLNPVMPYWVFHNLRPEDADAIVAYLRTVPGVDHPEPPNDPQFEDVPVAATPIDPATIPAPDGGANENGRYLAAMAGLCIECHTPEPPAGAPRPVDMTRPFGGNRPFVAETVGLPSPPLPATIYTANLSSHPTLGLGGWTAADVVRVLKQGRDRDGGGICPPMPAGPMAALGGLTDQDALDIANYIIGLPPVENAVTGGNGSCVVP